MDFCQSTKISWQKDQSSRSGSPSPAVKLYLPLLETHGNFSLCPLLAEGEATHSASSSKLRYTSSSFSVVSSEGKGLGRKGMTGLYRCLTPHSRAPELSPALSILLSRGCFGRKYSLQFCFCPRMTPSLLLPEGRAGRAGQESSWGGWLSIRGSTWAPK